MPDEQFPPDAANSPEEASADVSSRQSFQREMRRYCFRLIREVTRKLGWRYKLWIPAAMLLSSLFLLPQWFLQFFTESTQNLENTTLSSFLPLLAIYGGAIAICLWISIYFSGVLREWLRLTVSIGLRRDAVSSLNRMRIDKLDVGHRGEWMMRMTSDLRSCELFLTDSLADQIRQLTMLLGTFSIFVYSSGAVAFVLIPVAVVLVWFNITVQRRMAPTLTEARVIEGDVFQSMIESFEGLRTIRSYGAENFIEQRIDGQLKNLYRAGMRIIKSMASLMGLTELGSQLVITAVLTFAMFRIGNQHLTAEHALVYPFYINMFLGSVKGLAGATYDWNRFFVEGGRLASLLYDESKQIDDNDELYAELRNELTEVRNLSVENITIAYGDDPPVIENMNFMLATGEIVALMGPSGCGKSTLLESFSGLRPANQGDFKVELANGSSNAYPQAPVILSAFVEQHPYLFVGTIKANIAMGMDDVSDEMVWRSLEEVGLAGMIRFRGGLDEVLTDRGRNMSVGQQYRLALCRALVSHRPFLFLDEPFAALDSESIDRVVQALHQERNRGAGIVLITHMLPKTLEANRVVEMSRLIRS